jgi:hypothetical protein
MRRAALILASLAPLAAEAQTDSCVARIEVTLEASVEDPRDPSFLTALLANAMYKLSWVEGDDTTAVYELVGPASDFKCEREISQLSRSAQIRDLRVVSQENVSSQASPDKQ